GCVLLRLPAVLHADVQFVPACVPGVVLDTSLMALATKPAAVGGRGGHHIRRTRQTEHRDDEQRDFHTASPCVIAGLDPAIHHSSKTMDARVKPAHDVNVSSS